MEEGSIELGKGIFDKLLILISFHYAVGTVVHSDVLELELEELFWVLIFEVAWSQVGLQVLIGQVLHVLNICLSHALLAHLLANI